MGSKLSKRLTKLEQQTENKTGTFTGFFRFFFLFSFALALCIPVIGSLSKDESTDSTHWKQILEKQFTERYEWLKNYPLVGELSADWYFGYSRFIVKDVFNTDEIEKKLRTDEGLDETFRSAQLTAYQVMSNILLRFGFVTIGFWPFWLLATFAGYYYSRIILTPKATNDLLGVCDPGTTPFYSGIWGPLKPNHTSSGTDFSCPSLATPQMVSKQIAEGHRINAILKHFGATNDCNLDLCRIILAHRDYPAVCEYEHPAESQQEDYSFDASRFRTRGPSTTSFVTNKEGMLEQGSIEGLDAILKAHRIIVHIFKEVSVSLNFESFHATLQAVLDKGGNSVSPLVRSLCISLTPHRAKAFSELPSETVASAHLAIEAGKSLVYDKAEGKFVQISRFPHLQARAVIQSLPTYHAHYSGDSRQIIRQAIICSRRHGDFGRAFTPVRMPEQSRALRDLLEILYAKPNDRIENGYLVELDAHIEELSLNWREQFRLCIESDLHTSGKNPKVRFEKGLPFKSVVLMPIETVLRLAWKDIDTGRRHRIVELLSLTENLQKKLSVSARLPGFKRSSSNIEQTLPDNTVTKAVLSSHQDKEAVAKWVIIRRMLNRYNWLSTRVGDDPVPDDSLIQAVTVNEESKEVIGLPALVPIRQRRYKELFGSMWERKHYPEIANAIDVHVIVDTNEFKPQLERLQNLMGKKSNQEHTSTAA